MVTQLYKQRASYTTVKIQSWRLKLPDFLVRAPGGLRKLSTFQTVAVTCRIHLQAFDQQSTHRTKWAFHSSTGGGCAWRKCSAQLSAPSPPCITFAPFKCIGCSRPHQSPSMSLSGDKRLIAPAYLLNIYQTKEDANLGHLQPQLFKAHSSFDACDVQQRREIWRVSPPSSTAPIVHWCPLCSAIDAVPFYTTPTCSLKNITKRRGKKVQEKTHTSWLQACIIVVQFPPSNLICQSHWGSSRGKQATQTAATSQDYKWEAERKITLIFIPLWTLAEKDLSRRSFWKRYPAPRQLWHHLLVSQGLLFNICYLWSGSHCPLVHPVLAVDAHTEGDGG